MFAYTNINPSASHNPLVAYNKNKAWTLISYIPQLVIDTHIAKLRQQLLKACYNRQYFYQYLKIAYNQALLTNTELSIILIDIDNFHQINEQYDYQAGDRYLHSITTLLLEIIEDQGSLARYADNTFIILLPECGTKDAQKNAEHIKAEVESHHIFYQQQKINCKAVTGIATLQEAGINNANQLLHAADKSLALNKQSGRL